MRVWGSLIGGMLACASMGAELPKTGSWADSKTLSVAHQPVRQFVREVARDWKLPLTASAELGDLKLTTFYLQPTSARKMLEDVAFALGLEWVQTGTQWELKQTSATRQREQTFFAELKSRQSKLKAALKSWIAGAGQSDHKLRARVQEIESLIARMDAAEVADLMLERNIASTLLSQPRLRNALSEVRQRGLQTTLENEGWIQFGDPITGQWTLRLEPESGSLVGEFLAADQTASFEEVLVDLPEIEPYADFWEGPNPLPKTLRSEGRFDTDVAVAREIAAQGIPVVMEGLRTTSLPWRLKSDWNSAIERDADSTFAVRNDTLLIRPIEGLQRRKLDPSEALMAPAEKPGRLSLDAVATLVTALPATTQRLAQAGRIASSLPIQDLFARPLPWRVWAGLSAEQRGALIKSEAVPYANLSPTNQQLYRQQLALTDLGQAMLKTDSATWMFYLERPVGAFVVEQQGHVTVTGRPADMPTDRGPNGESLTQTPLSIERVKFYFGPDFKSAVWVEYHFRSAPWLPEAPVAGPGDDHRPESDCDHGPGCEHDHTP